METLKKYLLYFLVGIVICLVGVSGVFADTTIDTSSFINTTGRKWTDGTLEFTGSPNYNNDWLLNAYNVTGGIYTPPVTTDYIEFLYFEHNTSQFNPCNSSSKFTANFKLLFTNVNFMQFVNNVKWGDESCSIQERNIQNGVMTVNCVASPSSGNYTDIFVYFSEIQGTNTSNLYISRNIGITCGLNTDAIINNDNANTQNIINNNNENTQAIIEANKVCTDDIIDKNDIVTDNVFLSSSGSLTSINDYGITDYIELGTLEVVDIFNYTYASPSLCFYTEAKSLISCVSISSLSTGTISSPNNAYYFRSSIYKVTNVPTFKNTVCKNGNQALDDSINNLDDTLKDDDTSGATSEASDFFSDFNTNTFGLTSIITAPLNLIQSLTSSTCNDLELPLPYLSNKKLILPCMTTIYSTYFGTFFTLYQTITYGIIAYWVCVRIFNLVKDFKNPEHDEIEVLDL